MRTPKPPNFPARGLVGPILAGLTTVLLSTSAPTDGPPPQDGERVHAAFRTRYGRDDAGAVRWLVGGRIVLATRPVEPDAALVCDETED